MRLRMAQKRMTVREADMLQYYLEGFDFVKRAVVYERTCDVAIYYEDDKRDTVINKIKKLKFYIVIKLTNILKDERIN